MKNSENSAFRKKLISLILPITLQNFMFALVPLADTVMLAGIQDQMSAVSLASQVAFVFNMFAIALASGCSMFAAQYWGKGDKESIRKVFGYSVRLMLAVIIIFFGCTFFMPESVMRIYTSVPDIIANGTPYLRIASFSYIFMGLSIIYESVLKNVGFVKHCTIASGVMVFTNVILNAVFIYGLIGFPRMGASGAALATTISSLIGLVFCIVYSYNRNAIRLSAKYVIHNDMKLRKSFSKYSAPFLLNQIIWGIGFTMTSVIMGHLGSDAVAANAIAAVVKDLVSCFCFALSAGGAIVVGNELGAGRLDTAKDYGARIMKMTIISGIILGLIGAASTPLVLNIVKLTPQAEEYLKIMLYMCSYYIVGRSINSTTIGGIFSSGGDTKFGFICDTITMWAFIVPFGALTAFVLKWPVLAVYFVLNLDEIVKLPVVYAHYKKYKWVRNIVSDPEEVAG